MNKFKKVLLGALSVLTLGLFVVTGTKVNAETKDISTLDLSYYPASASPISQGTKLYGSNDTVALYSSDGRDLTPVTSKDGSSTYTDGDSNTITFNYGLYYSNSNSTSAQNCPAKVVVGKIGYGMDIYFTVTSSKFATDSNVGQSSSNFILYNSSISSLTTSTSQKHYANTVYKFSVNFDNYGGPGTYYLGATNRLVVFGVKFYVTRTNADNINDAKDAIDAIPSTTDDLDAYKTALDAAKDAIDLCDGGINDLPEAYQTKYNDAVSAYEAAFAAVAVDLAKDAIDAIPSTTDDLSAYKTALDAAAAAIAACENGIDDLPEAYQTTYNDAVAAYNTAYYNAQVNANNARFGQTSSFTANDVAEGAESNTVVSGGTSYIGSSIFIGANFTKQIIDSKNNSTAATILGTNYNGRLNTKSKTSIKFTTESAGAIAFLAMSGASDKDRSLFLYSSDGETSLGSVGLAKTTDTVSIQTINVPSAGTYYIGADGTNAINIYDVSFISSSTKALSQSYTEDGYTYIRFVNIVKGAATLTTLDFNFSVTMTYAGTTNTKTVDYTSDSYVVKKITKSGDDYVDTVNNADYTFADHTAEYYVVFVLRLTTSKFPGSSVCGNFTYNDLTIHSTSRTI